MAWQNNPTDAYINHIRPFVASPKWVEDSKDISKQIKLNKRELFGLIVLALAYGDDWLVGYDEADSEPNDGYITDGETKIHIEHKVIAQMDKREVLNAILETYEKYAARGEGYGENRVLIIHPNKAPEHGLIKISSLKDLIKGESPFDKVYTIAPCTFKGEGNQIAVMHVIEHFPREGKYETGKWLTQVDLNLSTGLADVPHKGIE